MSAPQTCAAQQFLPLPSLKGISAVPLHQSAPEKAVALSRYQRIKESAPERLLISFEIQCTRPQDVPLLFSRTVFNTT